MCDNLRTRSNSAGFYEGFDECVFSGDTRALCEDMKDFSQDYIDYSNMAKQLIPETNTVQHWSKMIETKYVLSVLSVT